MRERKTLYSEPIYFPLLVLVQHISVMEHAKKNAHTKIFAWLGTPTGVAWGTETKSLLHYPSQH